MSDLAELIDLQQVPDSTARLAAAIRKARERRGWSQRNLAEFAGVDFEMVRRLEAGRGEPRWDDAKQMLVTLDLIKPGDATALLRIVFGQKSAKE